MKPVYIGKSKIDEPGVFAGKYFSPGDRIIKYTGPVLTYDESHGPQEDYTIQIDTNKYLGPSGKEDDIVNHSCSPNAGLKWIDDELWLIAIWWIFKDDEITFDYSTTMGREEEWTMPCKCNSPFCRKTVERFDLLPEDLKEYYTKLGIALAAGWK